MTAGKRQRKQRKRRRKQPQCARSQRDHHSPRTSSAKSPDAASNPSAFLEPAPALATQHPGFAKLVALYIRAHAVTVRFILGLVLMGIAVVVAWPQARLASPARAAIATKKPTPLPAIPTLAVTLDSKAVPIARHVIIVSEDGMRPDALFEAPANYHQKMMQQAAFSMEAQTIRQASTLPSHAAMLSGFDVHDHGLTWNSWQPHRGFIKVPTILQTAKEAGLGSAAFVGKKKLEHIIRPGFVDVFARPGYLCRKIAEAAAAYFLKHRPQVEFVHFSDPDSGGHASGWMSDEQMRAVRSSDRCLETLVEAVAGSDLARDTLIIVSSDHGGKGHSHSGRIREDRLIPWIAWGVGVRPGYKIQGAVSTLDTAATALWALGHPVPSSLPGHPIKEAFKEAFKTN